MPLAAIECDQADHLLFTTVKHAVGVASGHALGARLQEGFELCFALNLWDPLLSVSRGIVKALDDEHGPKRWLHQSELDWLVMPENIRF